MPDSLANPTPETLNLYAAKTQLSQLVDRAAAGEEIVIAKNGKPMARLVPMPAEAPKPRERQNLLNVTYVAPDFDDELPEDMLRDWGIID